MKRLFSYILVAFLCGSTTMAQNVSINSTQAPEGSAMSFSITKGAGPATTINWTTVAASALASDYIEASGTVAFGVSLNDTTSTFTINTSDDVFTEADESFNIQLSTSDASTVLEGGGIGMGTILDNDVSYGVSNSGNLTEGNSGTTAISYTITRTGALSETTTVDFAITGTATFGADYNNVLSPLGGNILSGTLSFAPGITNAQITADVIGDLVVEGNETIVLSLSSPVASGSGSISTASSTLTVQDDDSAGLLLTQNALNVAEGTTADSYGISLISAPTSNVTISFTSTGGQINAIADVVFTPTSWATPQNVNVSAIEDPFAEGDHTTLISHTITSTDPTYSNLDASGYDVTVNIADNDIEYTLNSSTTSVNEGSAATANPVSYEIERTGVISGASTVDFSITGSATFGLDYNNFLGNSGITALTGTISFAAGETSKTFTLDIIDDNIAEGSETIVLTLLNGTAMGSGTIVGSPKSLTITDDDQPTVITNLASGSISESGTSTSFTVKLGSQPISNVVMNLSVSNAQEASLSVGTLTFTALNWANAQTVTINPLDDSLLDGNVEFEVNFSVTSSDPRYFGLSVTPLKLKNTDNEFGYVIQEVTSPVLEKDQNENVSLFKITRSGDLTRTSSVDIRLAGTVNYIGDYDISSLSGIGVSLLGNRITFGSLADNATIVIQTVGDNVEEIDKYWDLSLENHQSLNGDGVFGNNGPVRINLIDDDASPIAINNSYSINEDNTLSINETFGVLSNDTDNDDSNLTAILVSNVPASTGTLVFNNNGSFVFTPSIDYSGITSFSYQATDGTNVSNTATVTITVNSTNDAPTTLGIATQREDEDQGPIVISLWAAFDDAETPDSQLNYSITSNSNSSLFASTAITAADGNMTLVLAPDKNGSSTIRVRATDQGGRSASATFAVIVNPVNDSPVFSLSGDINELENFQGTRTVTVTQGNVPTDEQSQNVTYTINPTEVSFANVSVNSATGEISVTSIPNQFGSSSIEVIAFDGFASFSQTFNLTVGDVNNPPLFTLSNDIVEFEDFSHKATVSIIPDPNFPNETGESIIYTISPSSSSLVNIEIDSVSGLISVTSNLNVSGVENFSVTATDEFSNSVTRSLIVTVNPINDEPSINQISNFFISENSGTQTVNFSGVQAGPLEVQSMTVSAISLSPNLIANPITVNYLSPSTNGSLLLDPIPNVSGVATIEVTVRDNGANGGQNDNEFTIEFQVEIGEINSPPEIDDISSPDDIEEDSGVQTISLTGISAGINENQNITVQAFSSNTALLPTDSIEVTYNSPDSFGTLTYKPMPERYGKTNITILVTDDGPNSGTNQNSTATVFEVDVDPINDAPTINPIDSPLFLTVNSGVQEVFFSGVSPGPFEDQNITITASSSNPSLIPNPIVNYAGSGTVGSLLVSPVANASGIADITVKVKDSGPSSGLNENTTEITFQIVISDKPDLAIDLNAITPSSLVLGQSFIVNHEVVNQTSASASAHKIGYYLSLDNMLDAEDVFLSDQLIPSLGGLDDISLNTTLTIPASINVGTYFLIIIADYENTVEEIIESNNSDFGIITVINNDPPTISIVSVPRQINTSSTGGTFVVSATDDVKINRLSIFYRGIAASNWKRADFLGSSIGNSTFDIPRGEYDEIGLEYYFEATDGILTVLSDTLRSYLYYASGQEIPNLKYGSEVTDYNMISIPLTLDQDAVITNMQDEFGPYDIYKWRLFQYQNSNNVEFSANTKFIPGKASWLIVKEAPTTVVISEPGQTVEVYQGNPYQLNLTSGWNQIGNPYNFNVSWQDVITANGIQAGSDLTELSVYNSGFQNSNVLSKFSGGFVFNPNTTSTSITLPVLKNNLINNRPIPMRSFAKVVDLNLDNWSFPLKLKNVNGELAQSVFGIDQSADLNKDDLDRVNLPDFEHLQYAKISFEREYFYPDFKYDFIPGEQGVWRFKVNSNLDKRKDIEITWDDIEVVGEKQLILFDLSTNRRYDLSQQGSIAVGQNILGYEIYFGEKEFITDQIQPQSTTISNPYPNPIQDFLAIDFASKISNSGKVIIYDLQGKVVAEQTIQLEANGFVTVQIDLSTLRPKQVLIYEVRLLSGDIKRGKLLR